MAYSIQRDVSNGSLQYLEVRIDYFAKEHLSVFIAEKVVPQGTTPDPTSGYCWTWDGNRIKFNKAVANGLEVMVRRATPIAAPFHIFRQGAVFKDLTVDENFLQQLYINQENQEGQTTTDFYSDLNFHGYRLRNVGAAIHDYDAVPFSQYRADALGAMQQRIIAEQARDTTVSAKDTSVTAKTAAEAARDAALISQNAAKTSETNAKASETLAQKWATQTSAEVVTGQGYGAKKYADDATKKFSDFDKRYLGAKTSDPTVDNSGNALSTGASYFNTTTSTYRIWDGTVWATANTTNALPLTGGTLTGSLTLSGDATQALQPMTKQQTESRIGSQGALSWRNRIINGNMAVDQRNDGNAYTDSAGASGFAIDRWRLVTRTGATIRAQRSVSGGGSTRSHLAVTIVAAKTPAATDQFRVTQAIEGVNVGDLWSGTAAAKTVTLSFETCHSVAGTFSGSLMNAAFDRSFVFTYTQDVANTWERKTVTIALDKSGVWEYGSTTGLFVAFDYGSGSNFATSNVGTWQSGAFVRAIGGTTLVSTVNAIFRIQAVQLEEGSVATPFEQRSYGAEVALCQRYYEGGTGYGVSYAASSTLLQRAFVTYKCPKRAISTTAVTKFGGAGTAPVVIGVYVDGIVVGYTSTAAGQEIAFTWTADAEL